MYSKRMTLFSCMLSTLNGQPQAFAHLSGGPMYDSIRGNVYFYQTSFGVLVVADICGLPEPEDACMPNIFGFHIHNGTSCTGNEQDPFANTGTHLAIPPCEMHPYHAGDLPPLFGNNGVAFLITLTDRVSVKDILGKTILIHSQPDDFTTQPAGNAGKKIACGLIRNNSY